MVRTRSPKGSGATTPCSASSSSYMKDGDVFSEYRLADAISGREAEAAIGLRNQWTIAEGVRLSHRLRTPACDRRARARGHRGIGRPRVPRERPIQEHRTPRVAERFVERQLAVHRRLRAEAVAQLDDAGQELLSADRARGRAEPGAGSLLDRRGLPGYDGEPLQPADALRVQSRRHVRPVLARPACRSAPQPIDGCRWCRRTPTSTRCVRGRSRASTRRSSSTIERRPARADSASSWSQAASAMTSHNGGTSAP